MSSRYQHCTQNLVLPGGLQRLVRLDETTAWVQRAWTLQDALADPDSDEQGDGEEGLALVMLKGKEMDDDGYLFVEGSVCVVSAVTADTGSASQGKGRFARTVDGKLWEFLDGPRAVTVENADFPRSIAIFIARFSAPCDYADTSDESEDEHEGSGSSSDSVSASDLDVCKFMLATKHPGRFHAASYFLLREHLGGEMWLKKASTLRSSDMTKTMQMAIKVR
ncbi:hypothetical protein B0T17DRAFT_619203 [Bombardia bombarda]|uniref:Uncharacterized protein n=1 Tax=Bombardia bombarda TaxID=252184 RepID=A0AA39WHM1_9PEZI|nr:hypothetical protein B0T17DRAFT_619203 [Bombardia bombarda]